MFPDNYPNANVNIHVQSDAPRFIVREEIGDSGTNNAYVYDTLSGQQYRLYLYNKNDPWRLNWFDRTLGVSLQSSLLKVYELGNDDALDFWNQLKALDPTKDEFFLKWTHMANDAIKDHEDDKEAWWDHEKTNKTTKKQIPWFNFVLVSIVVVFMVVLLVTR